MTNKPKHTELPWRVGDAGFTVFGPPNGNPSPEVVATVKKKANAQAIVRACNAHEELLAAAKRVLLDGLDLSARMALKEAIAKAEKGEGE